MVTWLVSYVDDFMEITASHVLKTWPRRCHTHACMLTQIPTHLYWENNLNNNLQKQYAVLDSETPAALKRSERCRRWQKSSDSGECLLFCVSFLSPLWRVDISFIPSCLLHLCPFCLLSCFFHLLPRLPVIRINLVMVSVLLITQMAMVRILKLDALFFTSTNSVSLFKCYSVQSILPKCVTIQSLKMHKMPEKGNNWSYANVSLDVNVIVTWRLVIIHYSDIFQRPVKKEIKKASIS